MRDPQPARDAVHLWSALQCCAGSHQQPHGMFDFPHSCVQLPLFYGRAVGGDANYAAVFIGGENRTASGQAGIQLYCIAITLGLFSWLEGVAFLMYVLQGIAVGSGCLTGMVLTSAHFNDLAVTYNDDQLWEVPEKED